MSNPRLQYGFVRLAATFLILTLLIWGILSLVWPPAVVDVHVRWKPHVAYAQRIELERRFQLRNASHLEGNGWKYQLADFSTENIRTIVHNGNVEDTHHLDRVSYRPQLAIAARTQPILISSLVISSLGSIALLWLTAGFRNSTSLREFWSAQVKPTMSPRGTARVSSSAHATAAALIVGLVIGAAMTSFGASFLSAAAALLVVYACGYVVGSLLLPRIDGVALTIIRTITGLMLSSIGFLLSLLLSVDWYIVPGALIASALALHRRGALLLPHLTARLHWDGVVAAILAIVILSPITITFFYMAPGSFPPVLYNVDTAYSLEKVHSLVLANTFPPPSLGNLGLRRTYHYGTQAMAALISRSSGLFPHHALFLIVLPLLTAGVVVAAVAVTRFVCPLLPRSITVPVLLISTPSLSRSFWDRWGPQLWGAATSGDVSLEQIVGDSSLWGILSNEAQNVGGDFLILGSLAGIAAASALGWRFPAFLIGSSVLFKTTAGIALVAGFALAEAWQAVVTRRFRPSLPMLLTGTVFAATLLMFFVASFESAFRVEFYPFEHLRDVVGRERLIGFALDILWLLLPVLIVLSARNKDPESRSAPILMMAIAPLIVMNATRLVHVGRGGEGAGLDWVQISHSVPFLLHAFALSLANQQWDRLGRARGIAFLLTMALAIAPVAAAAARYSLHLLDDQESGNEFVDNRSIAAALAVIPKAGSVIVTNDLRYPANDFARADRQLQIPALFGHQAFSVNFSYEPVEDRRDLQLLLQRPQWSDAILEAARIHGWTHLIIRKDYVHPAPISLEQIFENEFYAVFRFP